MRSGSNWPMIGRRPCAYACAYVNPVFTSQSYDIQHKHKHKKNELVHFSCAYALVKTRLKILSCRVNTTSGWIIKQLGISFGSIFLLFSYESSQGPHLW